MKKSILCLLVVSLYFGAGPAAAQSGESGWISLFDGKSLSGWRASENKDTFSVRDGMIVTAGPRSHLFYVGPVNQAMFKDFELKVDVMTRPGSNAGVYIHTQYQETGWPDKGYEVQVNNTHKDWRKTGSLYAIKDVRESPAVDDKWFTEHIIVRGKRIIIKVDGEVMVDYTEPEGLDRPERQLSSGTFALQGHDPKSVVFFKNIRVKPLVGSISFEAIKADQLERIEQALPSRAIVKPAKPRKLLVFSLAMGFKHKSIPHGAKTFELMGQKSGAFEVVHSSDMSAFDWDHLKQFDAVLFNNTTRLTFDDPARRESLMRFIKGGKGVIGIHSATDNFYNWPEAARMMGGQFWGHPWHEKVTLKIEDPDHPCAKCFGGSSYEITDEIYQFRNDSYSRERLHILTSLDPRGTNMNKEKIKRTDGDFAVSWVQSFGKGRVFYCSLGHREEIFWNPVILQHYLAGIQFAIGDLSADTTPSGPKPVETAAELKGLDELLGKIKSYDYGQSRIALTELSDLTRAAYGSSYLMRVIEQRLLKFLRSSATPASKQYICRELSVIGTEASAPTLGSLLSESSTSDMARYALERIEGKAVDSVLRDALGKTSGKVQVGIISTLGMRRDSKSAAALGRLIYSSDRMVAEAAVSALGRIGNEKAAGFLRKASMELSGKLQAEVMDAYLQCADQVAKRGEKAMAKGMYNTIYRLDEAPGMIHVAAFKGLVEVSGSESVKLVVDAIHSDDRVLRGVAIGLVRTIPGTDIVRAASSELKDLEPSSQVQLLTALADRGDGAALAAVTAAASGGRGAVQVAALEALGSVGDKSTVMFLARAAAAEQGEARQAAQQSLSRLRGSGVDERIVAGVGQAKNDIKVELIRSVGQRRIASARGILLSEAESSDRDVRMESIKALREVSGSEDMPRLVDLLVAATDETQRREAALTLVAVAKEIQPKNRRARAVLAVLPAVKEVNIKCSLLSVLGRIGDDTALPAIRLALKGRDTKVADAAVDALAAWPSAGPMADVLAIAKSETNVRRQVVALKGYIKMVALPSGRSKAETTRLLAGAYDLARRADEKRAVLGVLPGFACPQALKLAESALSDQSVANEAEAAVKKIKKALR